MKIVLTIYVSLMLSALQAIGQTSAFQVQKTLRAGEPLSISTSGSGPATMYIVGLGQVAERTFQLGKTLVFEAGELHNAGHYTAILVSASGTQTAEFDLTPAAQPKYISFLARPSRAPVNLPNEISGVAYLFDVFRNLVVDPTRVTFLLSENPGASQERTVSSAEGVAWVLMNSASKAGIAQFSASAEGTTERRVLQLVPGDPCSLKMTARRSGNRIDLETEPVRDCGGNPVPDGTIVTFTESYHGMESTVDAPLKRGVARTQMPAYPGGSISVASGVVMGNEIRVQAD
jgi:hypothetical protein